MVVVSADLVKDKKVLLRYDIDVPIEKGKVVDDFRLKAGLKTLKLCLENAEQVIMMGHVGRPASTSASLGGPESVDSEFSVAPIYQWLLTQNELRSYIESEKLRLLENLRFESGEDEASLEYAKELAELGDLFINEAFAAYHKSASTTVLPTLLSHVVGLHFSDEVNALNRVREDPKKPLIVIMGGAKVQDKLPVIQAMAKISDQVLVGGKLVKEINDLEYNIPKNTILAELIEDGLDVTEETIQSWNTYIKEAKMIVWNGPMGKIEDPENSKGTKALADLILDSSAEVIVGGGDTVGFLDQAGLLDKYQKKGFVSSGGGAMLKFLTDGTLPTIEALK